MRKELTFSAALLLALVLTTPAEAGLIRAPDTDLQGTGLGHVFTVLTIRNDGIETGCSFWNGSMSMTGNNGCPVGGFGGHEQALNSTFSLQELGLTDFSLLRIGYKPIEAGGQRDTWVDLLVLLIQNSAGELLAAPSLAAPVHFLDTAPGTGKGIFSFMLGNTDHVLNANANLLYPTNRLGLAAQVSMASAGHESFFFHVIPEPAACWLIGAGLIVLGLLRSRRQNKSA